MSVQSTGIGKFESFFVKIDGNFVLIDHILQTTLYSGIGILGSPGEMVVTAQAFRMLNPDQGMSFNPVGKTIQFELNDPKSGILTYEGVITSISKTHDIKQDAVVLGFDKPNWVKLKNLRWFKAFEKVNILQVVEDFFETFGVPVNVYPEDNFKFRGTFWENFAMPMNGPALNYLLEELTKDNFLFFNNPEDDGIIIVNWSDLQRLDSVMKNAESFVVDKILAKFDANGKEWKDHTFVLGKQIDTSLLSKIQGFSGVFQPNITGAFDHQCTFYSALKKPLFFDGDVKESEVGDNGLRPENVENYPGHNLKEVQIAPYPALRNLVNADVLGTYDYGETFKMQTQSITFPRYMYYRMQQSYAKYLNLVSENIIVPGSVKAIMPLSAVPISVFENARVIDPRSDFPPGDNHFSGLFLIWSSKLVISGPNLLSVLQVVKPYHHV